MCVGEVILVNDLLGVVVEMKDNNKAMVRDKRGEVHEVNISNSTSILTPKQTALMFYHKLRTMVDENKR